MADRTDWRLTRDLMLDAVPWGSQHITEAEICMQRTYSSANIFAARDTWSLGATRSVRPQLHIQVRAALRTNDERNHGRSIAPGGFQSLDELLDLPDFDVLLSLIGLRVTHFGGRWRFYRITLVMAGEESSMRFRGPDCRER